MSSPKNRNRTGREKVTLPPNQPTEALDIDESIEADDIRELKAELAEMERARQVKEDAMQAAATRRQNQINQAQAQLNADLQAANNELSEDAGEIKHQRKMIQRAIEREKKRREEALAPEAIDAVEHLFHNAELNANGAHSPEG